MGMHSHSLLFNPVQFTKSLEEGLTQALALAHSGQAPKNLYIRDVVALES